MKSTLRLLICTALIGLTQNAMAMQDEDELRSAQLEFDHLIKEKNREIYDLLRAKMKEETQKRFDEFVHNQFHKEIQDEFQNQIMLDLWRSPREDSE